MPPIASTKQVLDRLYNLVSPSVVVIRRSKDGHFVQFGTGFVIYSDRSIVLLCSHESIVKDGESLSVHFHDSTTQHARVFMRIPSSRHVIIEVEAIGARRRVVNFADYPVGLQNIFTVAAVEDREELGLMTGTISITNCRAISQTGGHLMHGSQNLFAMSCPAAGPMKIGAPQGEGLELVGAAVFDMRGLVIGTVDFVDPSAYDLKFSRKTSSFLDNLELVLKASDAKIYLSRDHGCFTQGARTSGQKGSTSGSGSRKRGHEDSAGGGMRTEKSLCMDQLEVNVEMVSQNRRLQKYPVQGDMEVARREAMQRALVRHVTRESDDQLRGTPSSPDAGIEANECMRVFIARNPDELGSENSISVRPFDLNHFFGEDGKIYGYKNLKINVWISAISFHACADISFLEKSDGGKGITDLKPALLNIFGENLVEKDEFVETFSKECQFISGVVTDGCVIKHAASNEGDSAVEIVRVELQGAAAILYSRLVPLVLLLVEGSTTIDIKGHGWEMLLAVKKATHESSTPKFQLLGFAAARHFYHYPEGTHLQISQILVLPPYQGECHGHLLIEAINSIALSENIYDVTIEDPPDYLQHIHSSIDCLRLLTFDPIKPVLGAMVSSLKEAKLPERTRGLTMVPPADLAETVRLKLKMNLKQFLRCWEILMCLNLDAEDHESMDKLRACIYDRVKGEILGNPTGKQVASSLDEGPSLAVCWAKEEQRAEDVKTQEEELNELVDKKLEEIAKVAKNLVTRREEPCHAWPRTN